MVDAFGRARSNIRDAVSAMADHKVDPSLRAPVTSEALVAAITAVQACV